MKRKSRPNRSCPNPKCSDHGKVGHGNVIRHSMYVTKSGRRRRFLCKTCGKTFASTSETPYYRLHKPRSDFDQVVQMTVEGVSISSISRIKSLAWNTVKRWQDLASRFAELFNEQHLRGFEVKELQADEICTFVDTKKKTTWILTAIEVWSRLWPSFEVGRRSYRNVRTVSNEVISRGEINSSIQRIRRL